jgi:hypothetical protein
VSADQFIAARVSSETKVRLRELADRQQLSESGLLRRLVELLLPTAGVAPIMTASPIGTGAPRTARLMIRLRADDQIMFGRNLNQIARAANQGQLVTSPGRDDLEAMLRICEALRDHVKGLLVANLKSWEQGSV